MQDPGEQALEHGGRESPHNGIARWLSEEESVQGPITASGGYVGGIHEFCEGV